MPGKGHPYFNSIGENLYITPDKFTVEQAIEEWNTDGKHFDYYQNTCVKQQKCDRFTQLIWGDSYKLGCGANHCKKGIQNSNLTSGILFVCNYTPSGNLKGELPYIRGPPCTYCGPDFCRDKLCSDPDRESINQYPNWKPDFGSASILLSKCFLLLLSIIIHILW
ncbi:GLIPR1-like protein 2 [Amblyraja radiata]|uniref:GLIPR1-like protein 2 n=1 Tax=Amblyraja radiata TaxID=386614 RepID=UPI001401D165|nr:GLIPR1-like protein 2 [Amblyraja radiata]